MNKKLLTIFLSLFLVSILSVSCSNSDKTGSTIDDSKGIEQFNGNTYVSKDSFDASSVRPELKTAYLWVSVKDGQVATLPSDNTTPPDFDIAYFAVTGSGTDYSFSLDSGSVVGTLKFSSDGSSVTLRYTANPGAPAEMLNKNIVCNKR
ncbi:hypothetical protein [Brachyspira intermedia]|uniref:hypothetical protein n=1 Tax=Brachyspira intermedia TaxID=84377 RepID=UPI003007A429